MRVLIIVASHSFKSRKWHPNISTFPDSILKLESEDHIDIIGISSSEEDLPPLRDGAEWACGTRSLANPGLQLTKVCHALKVFCAYRPPYDWYIKTRPDLQLHEPIDLTQMAPGAINSRVRKYAGPLKLKKAASVGGTGLLQMHRTSSIFRSAEEKIIIPDDQIYVFDHSVVDLGAFEYPPAGNIKTDLGSTSQQHEWFHEKVWRDRGVSFNIVSIDCTLLKYGSRSGDLLGPP